MIFAELETDYSNSYPHIKKLLDKIYLHFPSLIFKVVNIKLMLRLFKNRYFDGQASEIQV